MYLWETFSRDYLNHKYDRLYSICELNTEQRNQLSLPYKDVGIDFIVYDGECKHAVQAKFKKNAETISWKKFSTFDALCNRTGPWTKRIFITNATNVKIYGNILSSDVLYGKQYFEKMKREEWVAFLKSVSM